MRQLLIIAVETDHPLDVNHLAIHVPRIVQRATGRGVVLDEPFTKAAAGDAARACVSYLMDADLDGDPRHVSIMREMSAGEVIAAGYQQMMAIVDRHDREIDKQHLFNARVLASVVDVPSDGEPA